MSLVDREAETGLKCYCYHRQSAREYPPLAETVAGEVLTLSTPKARNINGQGLKPQKLERWMDRAPSTGKLERWLDRTRSPPLPTPPRKNLSSSRKMELCLKQRSTILPSGGTLIKPLSFCTSTCLKSLAFVAACSQTSILFGFFITLNPSIYLPVSTPKYIFT